MSDVSNIIAPRKARFHVPVNLRDIDFLTTPIINGATGESYKDEYVADGGLIPELVDMKVRRFISAFDNKVANPQFKTDSDWTKQSGWTIDAGKPGTANYSGPGLTTISQASVVVSSQQYMVIVKCSEYTTGTFTPKLGTASNGTITGVGITTHIITANGTGFAMDTGPANAKFEYMYVLDVNDYRFDMIMNSNQDIDSVVLDGHNLLDSLPSSVYRSARMYHNTTDNFGTSTEVVVNEMVAGLLGKDKPSVLYNGIDSNVIVDWSSLGFVGEFTLEFTFICNDYGSPNPLIGRPSDDTNNLTIETSTSLTLEQSNNRVGYTLPVPLVEGQKYHLALTQANDFSNILYLDGVAVDTGQSTNMALGNIIRIGLNNSEYFDGIIFDVKKIRIRFLMSRRF